MYIKGINTLDTLYFQDLNEQTNFFDSKVVKTVNNTYYPPHFTNRIKFSTEDINFNSQINYLRLYHNEKYYYYFINNIEYKNEDVFYLDITMDTIQTYMFNIDFINSSIDRISINRWNSDGTINRDYVRENVSNADTKLYKYEINDFNGENDNNLLGVVISTEPLGNESSKFGKDETIKLVNNISNTRVDYYSGLYVYCFPMNEKYTYVSYKEKDGSISSSETDVSGGTIPFNIYQQDLLRYLRKKPSVISINLFNNSKYIQNILGIEYSDNHIQSNYNKLSQIVIDFDNPPQTLSYVINVESAELNYRLFSSVFTSSLIGVSKNSNLNSNFNYLNVPQIIDENYYRLEYGEKVGNTTYPLHKIKKDNLIFRGKYDITTNTRGYYITEEDTEEDKYNTNIICNTNENLQLVNDAWINYQAINEGTLTSGVKLSYMNNLFKTAKGSLPFYNYNSIYNNINGRAMNSNNMLSVSYTGEVSNIASFLTESYNIDKKLQITKENLEGTPDTLRQGNSSIIDLRPCCFLPYRAIYVVEDIEDVAKRLEMYGYKVNIILGNENLFNKFNNRYYYNIIKTKDLEINLKNIISDNATIENIKSRFNNGLRLWNTRDIGNFKYDNVEKIELEV